MQQQAPQTVGIDIGASTLHVALSHEKNDPIHQIDIEDPRWQQRLAQIVEPGALVALEPTGWHYSAPIQAEINRLGARVLLVNHHITANARALKISGIKTDRTDARALQYIAAMTANGEKIEGIREIDTKVIAAAMGLRMLIWSRRRMTKEKTRSMNRIRQLAHSIYPIINQEVEAFIRATRIGMITPAQLQELAYILRNEEKSKRRNMPAGFTDKRMRDNLYRITDNLPPWIDAGVLPLVIQDEITALDGHEAREADLAERITQVISGEPFRHLSQLWMTVPGSSPVRVAFIHAATLGDAASMTPAQMRAAIGYNPKVSQSGETKETIRHRHGFTPAKDDIHMWVQSLINQEYNPIAATFQAHKARDHRYALRAAKTKLINILSGIARSGQPYDPAIAGR